MRKLLVLLSAVAFVVAFTVPVMAADWSFYGSARMTTFWDSDSEEASPTGFEDDDLAWALQGNSRIGANVKAGDISGRFEYGTGVNLRILYGAWNFGAGTLLVGQTYGPVNLFQSNQVWGSDNDMLNFGGVYGGRNPMIQVAFGKFKIALLSPNAATPPAIAALLPTDIDTSIPKLEASYGFNIGPVGLTVVGGYQTYDVVGPTDEGIDVASYIVGLGFNIGFGPLYIKGDVYTGQNLGQYGLYQAGADDVGFSIADQDIIDNDTTGWLLVVGFKVSDMFAVEAGYGNNSHELDVSGSDSDDTSAYYLQATINLAKGCFITPEIGKIDYQDDAAGNEQGDTTYYGAKWQINF